MGARGMIHHLLTEDQYARDINPLHPSQVSLVEANVAAGNAVSICTCGSVILALERKQVIERFIAHVKAVKAARRNTNN